MKRAPKKKLSPQQHNRLKQIGILLLVAILAWMIFAPGRGVIAVFKQHSELVALREQNKAIELENTKLHEQIDRLKKDPVYLEDLARREYGLIKEHEFIYDFSKPEKKEK